ncbi:MAG TPA: sigma-70 family RNA polymerase sigma factor [Gemmataceae bacterium]|nr:sigma-70 family RNA polymerase sigma factor [Gemmataceae bacterium]
MDDIGGDFTLLMGRVLAGSDRAAKALLDRYGPQIRLAVRRRLNQQMRTQFDSLDFTQDVWASFFANPPTLSAICGPSDFVAYLEAIAKHKVIDATRRYLVGQKCNINREVSLEDSTLGVGTTLAAAEPTPSEIVSRREQLDRYLIELPIVYRRILVLLCEGEKPPAIAKELGIKLRSVQRIIAKLLSRGDA